MSFHDFTIFLKNDATAKAECSNLAELHPAVQKI